MDWETDTPVSRRDAVHAHNKRAGAEVVRFDGVAYDPRPAATVPTTEMVCGGQGKWKANEEDGRDGMYEILTTAVSM